MDINNYKKKLEEEKIHLEKELGKIAMKNPQNPEDWETKAAELNIMASDQSEMADVMEEVGNVAAMETELEDRLNEIKHALSKIEKGAYGVCDIEGCKIEEDRLKADPAAPTCIKHADRI